MPSDNGRRYSSVSKKETIYTNAEIMVIDEKLKIYFENNISLPIIDNVSLMPASGKYTNIDNLFVTYGNEKILKLSEYKKNYPDSYDKIMHMLKLFAKKKDDTVPKQSSIKKEETIKETPKVVKSRADQFIDTINELNDAIPHEEISTGLDQTCQLIKQINLTSKDKKSDKLNKLYDFYLPALVTILNKYRELNDSPIHGDEFEECENQLMKTIILVNQAMKSLYNSIHEYEYMDLNADINTLQSILKKDGLLDEDPFKENK